MGARGHSRLPRHALGSTVHRQLTPPGKALDCGCSTSFYHILSPGALPGWVLVIKLCNSERMVLWLVGLSTRCFSGHGSHRRKKSPSAQHLFPNLSFLRQLEYSGHRRTLSESLCSRKRKHPNRSSCSHQSGLLNLNLTTSLTYSKVLNGFLWEKLDDLWKA